MMFFPVAFLIFFGGLQYVGVTVVAIFIIAWGALQIGWGCDVLYYKNKMKEDLKKKHS